MPRCRPARSRTFTCRARRWLWRIISRYAAKCWRHLKARRVMSERKLPPGFEDLEPLLAEWNLASERERYCMRLSKTLDQLHAFYDAILPRMKDVMAHLETVPMSDVANLSAPVRNLYHLALSYMEASHPIELNWRATDLPDAFPASRIVYQMPSSVS